MDLFRHDFMREALLVAALVGVSAPAVGIFLVQRGLSLMGDGIGHVVFMGVAAGLVLGWMPIATALVFAVAGAVTIELLRQRGKISSDVALALIFYLGIAGGIFFLGLGGGASNLELYRYLFGSVVTVNEGDLVIVAVVAVLTLFTMVSLRKHFFAVAYDEEIARVSGLPVTGLNLLAAVTAAMIVAITAKVVGVLLVSALLVLPVAAVQQVTRSFRATFFGGILAGLLVTTTGLVVAFYTDQYPAATIVLLSIGLFLLCSVARTLRRAG